MHILQAQKVHIYIQGGDLKVFLDNCNWMKAIRRWKNHIIGLMTSGDRVSSHIASISFDNDSADLKSLDADRWHPSIGMKLPPLRALYMPRNAEDRLHMKKERRMEYCSFKAYSEGPTEHSCWVIQGIILRVSLSACLKDCRYSRYG